MSPPPFEYLRHILDEVRFLAEQFETLTQEQFLQDEMCQRVVTRSFEIIDEPVKNLPAAFREKHSAVA